MNTTMHPLVGRFVSGYLFGQNSIALVEKVKMSGRGKNRTMTGLIVRPHCASAASRVDRNARVVDEDTGKERRINSWEVAQQTYVGNRRHIPLDVVQRVWVGPHDAWVDYADFIEWCSGEEP